MWGKGIFTAASFLYFSAICCSLPGCFRRSRSRQHAAQYRGQPDVEFISVCAAQDLQMDVDRPARSAKVRVGLVKDFSCVVYNNQYIVYMSRVNTAGTRYGGA